MQCVKDIYRMFVSEKLSVYAIARELNRKGVEYIGDSEWDYQAVYAVLTHPKYAGCLVFGRTSRKLYTPRARLPKSEWIFTPGAFDPIVDPVTLAEARKILDERTINKSDDELLDRLRALLASEGRLTLSLIQHSADLPSPSTYRDRFGSLRRAYELIGYGRADQFDTFDLRRRIKALREELFAQIVATFPNDVSIVRRGGRWRSRLRLPNGLIVSVLVARSVRIRKEAVRWRIDPVRREHKFVTLLARLDEGNRSFLDFHVLPCIDRRNRFYVSLRDPWLDHQEPLREVSQFCEVVMRVRAARRSDRKCESAKKRKTHAGSGRRAH
ncbi:MAG: recombinase family protein [Candidatus Acidiferrales bacterium]